MSSMSEIEVRNLSKTFTQKDLKVDALSDININIEKVHFPVLCNYFPIPVKKITCIE